MSLICPSPWMITELWRELVMFILIWRSHDVSSQNFAFFSPMKIRTTRRWKIHVSCRYWPSTEVRRETVSMVTRWASVFLLPVLLPFQSLSFQSICCLPSLTSTRASGFIYAHIMLMNVQEMQKFYHFNAWPHVQYIQWNVSGPDEVQISVSAHNSARAETEKKQKHNASRKIKTTQTGGMTAMLDAV